MMDVHTVVGTVCEMQETGLGAFMALAPALWNFEA